MTRGTAKVPGGHMPDVRNAMTADEPATLRLKLADEAPRLLDELDVVL